MRVFMNIWDIFYLHFKATKYEGLWIFNLKAIIYSFPKYKLKKSFPSFNYLGKHFLTLLLQKD